MSHEMGIWKEDNGVQGISGSRNDQAETVMANGFLIRAGVTLYRTM